MESFQSVFPESPRVRFGVNPIIATELHVQFPPVLTIASRVPDEYQGRLRGWLPQYASETIRLVTGQDVLQHRFSASDESELLFLRQDALTYQASSYESWERFFASWNRYVTPLVEIYKIESLAGFGLRYVDAIKRSSIDAQDQEWKDLIRPELLGELSVAEATIRNGVQARTVDLTVQLNSEGEAARIIHGLARDPETKEEVYIINANFTCTELTDFSRHEERLSRLKRHAGRFFRWAITDELRNRLGPTILDTV